MPLAVMLAPTDRVLPITAELATVRSMVKIELALMSLLICTTDPVLSYKPVLLPVFTLKEPVLPYRPVLLPLLMLLGPYLRA